MTAEYAAKTTDNGKTAKSENGLRLFSRAPSTVSIFTLLVLITLYYGWLNRDEYFMTAEFGLGYSLGIIGGVMMLLLLVYPLRKRFQKSQLFIFSTKNWFKLHMILGVLGPLLILYHCNFSFGSTNSNIALVSMLLMVASGLVGRFIYGKIHHGLFGKKIELKELRDHELLAKKQLDSDQSSQVIVISEAVSNQLKNYERYIVCRSGFFSGLINIFILGLSTRINYWWIVRKISNDQQNNEVFSCLSNSEKNRHLRPIKRHIAVYLSTVRRMVELSFYEKLFSLWHMLHLPIFFMLIITGFVHVYAVHTY